MKLGTPAGTKLRSTGDGDLWRFPVGLVGFDFTFDVGFCNALELVISISLSDPCNSNPLTVIRR